MDKYILLFAIYSRKYSRIWSLSIDITLLEYYFSYYYLFVIIRYDIDILDMYVYGYIWEARILQTLHWEQ